MGNYQVRFWSRVGGVIRRLRVTVLFYQLQIFATMK